jgi:hypothetical protein
MKALALVIIAGCYHDKPVMTPVVTPIADLTLSEAAVGPITPASTATLQALRATMGSDFVVTPINVNNTLRYDITRNGEHVLDVKGDDDGHVDTVRVSSVRVAVAGRPWHVGEPFKDPSVLTACECDDDAADRTVCYSKGAHIAVGFKRTCDNLDDARERAVLTGVTIDRLVWSAKPWGDDSGDGPDPCAAPPPSED